MKSATLQALVDKAKERVYKNALSQSDSDISSGLRKGVMSAHRAFEKLDGTSEDAGELLNKMLACVRTSKAYYTSLPQSEGTWECSALRMMEADIEEMIEQGYRPMSAELTEAEKTIQENEEEQIAPYRDEIKEALLQALRSKL